MKYILLSDQGEESEAQKDYVTCLTSYRWETMGWV